MGYKRIIICEVCGKEENLDKLGRDKWYVENILHQICSEKCFENQMEQKQEIPHLDRNIPNWNTENMQSFSGKNIPNWNTDNTPTLSDLANRSDNCFFCFQNGELIEKENNMNSYYGLSDHAFVAIAAAIFAILMTIISKITGYLTWQQALIPIVIIILIVISYYITKLIEWIWQNYSY